MDIKIIDMNKSYGDKTVLQDFSAEIKAGICNILMGPSGCGKTTLLRILMGLERADSGRVEGLPAHISAVFQEDRLCEDFSAIVNVALVMERHYPRGVIREHLTRIGLEGSLDQPVRELSGGMKRRVAIVRAVLAAAAESPIGKEGVSLSVGGNTAGTPERAETANTAGERTSLSVKGGGCLLLMDEPFKGLDEGTREGVINYFLENTKGITSLVVTHDSREADMLRGPVLRL